MRHYENDEIIMPKWMDYLTEKQLDKLIYLWEKCFALRIKIRKKHI